jgi:hypothetical protein
MTLAPGQPVLHRHFADDVLVWAPLTRVVADDERGLRLWLAHGSPLIRQLSADGRPLRGTPFAEWITLPKQIRFDTYRGPSILKFNPRGAAHSVWWLWDVEHRFVAWYVNLEEPSVRWHDGDLVGVDLTDQDLDMWVWPDHTWQYKDEDEFAERLAFPEHYWVHDEAAVWAEARAMVPLIEARAFPFDGTWCDFRPDPTWELPEPVRDGWNRPRARLSA